MKSHTPPRSPHAEKYFGRTLSPKTSGGLFDLGPKDKMPVSNLANNFSNVAAAQGQPFDSDLDTPSQSAKSKIDNSGYQGTASNFENQ